MKLKSYFAASVDAAMEMARRELGEDALLVNARPTTPETRSLGAMEIVFGIAPKSSFEYAPPLPVEQVVNVSPPRLPALQDSTQDVAGLRREVERMAEALRLLSAGSAAAQVKQPAVYTRLTESELDVELARQVADGLPLEDVFTVDATLGKPKSPRAIVALVGPPGAGKTTTLVKLAARYGLAARRPAHIISTDVYRIAAADQLRTLSSILGIGCTVVETVVALGQVLEEHRNKELIFVDTPGLTRAEMRDASDLARLVSAHPNFDTHLVIPASMKPADMTRTIVQYQIFAPRKLLFTRLDETTHFGGLINQSARHSLPISFLSAGQQIPDHLEPATKAILATLVLGRRVAQPKADAPKPRGPKTLATQTLAPRTRAQGAGA